MNSQPTADAVTPALVIATQIEEPAAGRTDRDIRLESCTELDCIVVRTRSSVYEVIVLSGATAEVMVRGGRFFPEFRRATIAGSIFGSSAVKLRSICVGLHLELHVDGQSFVTSRIQSVSRYRTPVAEDV